MHVRPAVCRTRSQEAGMGLIPLALPAVELESSGVVKVLWFSLRLRSKAAPLDLYYRSWVRT